MCPYYRPKAEVSSHCEYCAQVHISKCVCGDDDDDDNRQQFN